MEKKETANIVNGGCIFLMRQSTLEGNFAVGWAILKTKF